MHILDNAEPGKNSRQLEGAPQPHTEDVVWPGVGDGLSQIRDGARINLFIAGNHVEECRFAGAIWPNQAGNLPLGHSQRAIVERNDAAKRFRDTCHFQDVHADASVFSAGFVAGCATDAELAPLVAICGVGAASVGSGRLMTNLIQSARSEGMMPWGSRRMTARNSAP